MICSGGEHDKLSLGMFCGRIQQLEKQDLVTCRGATTLQRYCQGQKIAQSETYYFFTATLHSCLPSLPFSPSLPPHFLHWWWNAGLWRQCIERFGLTDICHPTTQVIFSKPLRTGHFPLAPGKDNRLARQNVIHPLSGQHMMISGLCEYCFTF